MAVGCPAFIGYELAWDTFTSEMSIRKYGAEKWEPYSGHQAHHTDDHQVREPQVQTGYDFTDHDVQRGRRR